MTNIPPDRRKRRHNMPVTYLETGTQNPFYNLAFEEFVLTHRL